MNHLYCERIECHVIELVVQFEVLAQQVSHYRLLTLDGAKVDVKRKVTICEVLLERHPTLASLHALKNVLDEGLIKGVTLLLNLIDASDHVDDRHNHRLKHCLQVGPSKEYWALDDICHR